MFILCHAIKMGGSIRGEPQSNFNTQPLPIDSIHIFLLWEVLLINKCSFFCPICWLTAEQPVVVVSKVFNSEVGCLWMSCRCCGQTLLRLDSRVWWRRRGLFLSLVSLWANQKHGIPQRRLLMCPFWFITAPPQSHTIKLLVITVSPFTA